MKSPIAGLTGDQLDLLPSYIIWNKVIFESFQAGYLKPLDYDLCMGLSNSTAKRMYRFLDKRFHHKPDWTFDLKEFAHEHIGLGRNYEGPAHLKRNLLPAIEELEAIGFLEPMADTERFPKDGKDWKIRLIQKSTIAARHARFPATHVAAAGARAAVLGHGACQPWRDQGDGGRAGASSTRPRPSGARSTCSTGWRRSRTSGSPGARPGIWSNPSPTITPPPKGFVSREERQAARGSPAGRGA